MIARPARVRIRSRKPWVLDRRRLFGWNVRLLTRYSHYTTSTVRTHRSEEHTSELQSRQYLVCRLLLEKKKNFRFSCFDALRVTFDLLATSSLLCPRFSFACP